MRTVYYLRLCDHLFACLYQQLCFILISVLQWFSLESCLPKTQTQGGLEIKLFKATFVFMALVTQSARLHFVTPASSHFSTFPRANCLHHQSHLTQPNLPRKRSCWIQLATTSLCPCNHLQEWLTLPKTNGCCAPRGASLILGKHCSLFAKSQG